MKEFFCSRHDTLGSSTKRPERKRKEEERWEGEGKKGKERKEMCVRSLLGQLIDQASPCSC